MKYTPKCCKLAEENIEFCKVKGTLCWNHKYIDLPFIFCPYCGHKFINPITSQVKEHILAKITEQARNSNYDNVEILKASLRILGE